MGFSYYEFIYSLFFSGRFVVYLCFEARWNFSVDSFKELFLFGGWLLFAGMISKIFDNIYILTIGKLFSIAQVGFYTQAKKIII